MFDFCLPTTGTKVPSSPEWLHEIKYDGYRLRVERNGDRARLITRGGYDWTKRFPWIVEAALKNRQKHFVIDGEAVILGVDGISDFDALHSGRHIMMRFSCAPSISSLKAETICASCRCRCARFPKRLLLAPRCHSAVARQCNLMTSESFASRRRGDHGGFHRGRQRMIRQAVKQRLRSRTDVAHDDFSSDKSPIIRQNDAGESS
jgi:hypothetical protein